jgi:roadblock/LC7 domain-containing protein
MSIVTELLARPGVIAAGEYAYRGDRFSYRGALTEELARLASIMCRATTLATSMQGEMLAAFRPHGGIQPVRGWLVRGPKNTVCVMVNVFCFLDNDTSSLNAILHFMRQALANANMDLV